MRSRRRRNAPFSLFAFQDIITAVAGVMILITMMLALEVVADRQSAPDVITPRIAERLERTVAENESRIRKLDSRLAAASRPLAFDAESLQTQLAVIRQSREKLLLQQASLTRDLDAARQREETATKRLTETHPERLRELQDELRRVQTELSDMRTSNRIIFNRPPGETRSPWLVEIASGEYVAAEIGRTMKPLIFQSSGDLLEWARTQSSAAIYFVLLVKPDAVEQFDEVRGELRREGFTIGFDLLAAEQQAINRTTGADTP